MKAIIKLELEYCIENLYKIDKYKIICGNKYFLNFPKLILRIESKYRKMYNIWKLCFFS